MFYGGRASTPSLSSPASNFVLSKQKLVILTNVQDPYLSNTCYDALYQHSKLT